MKSIYFRLAMLLAATTMITTAAIAPAGAQLSPIAYGFPSVYQNSDTTAFSRDVVSATDFEDLAINFGSALTGACGLGGFGGFPSIVQTVEKTYYAEHMDFYHNEETAAFNCPYLGLGGLSGLPFGIC